MAVDQHAEVTLRFRPGLATKYGSVRDLVRDKVKHSPKKGWQIAEAMGMSETDLCRKLNPTDQKRSFSVENLEQYIRAEGDLDPVYYLVETFIVNSDAAEKQHKINELERMVAELKDQLRKQ